MRKHNKYIADVTKQAAHHEALVRGDGRAGDGPGVAHADVLARALVVVPELQQAVLAAGNVVGPARECLRRKCVISSKCNCINTVLQYATRLVCLREGKTLAHTLP